MNALALNHCSVANRLEHVTVSIPPGSLVGVIGPNGSGKSTLLQVAAGLLPCDGEVLWNDVPVASFDPVSRAQRGTWVPQEARFEFGFTVRSVVAQGRFAFGDDSAGIEDALREWDLESLADRPVTKLSGGERQRVVLARAAVTQAKLQFWDEPLAALDPRHGLELLAHARRRVLAGATLLFSLHDLRLCQHLDRVLLLHRGKLRAHGTPEQVLRPELLLEVFGVVATVSQSLAFRLP